MGRRTAVLAFPPEQAEKHGAQADHHCYTRQRHHADRYRRVFPGVRIELCAEQENLIEYVRDAIIPRVHQRQIQIRRGVMDAEKIIGDFPLGRHDVDGGFMIVHADCRVPHIVKTDDFG